jgi:phosphohistidine phosphatase
VTHTLVLLRHADAEGWAASDAERVLASHGVDAAAAVGDWFREQGIQPASALISAAVRTRQTWALVAEHAGWTLTPQVEAALYTASPDSALDLVRLTDESVGTLLVLGHNPTIHYLAQLLSDGQGDAEAETALLSGFAPATVAVFEVDVSWDRLSQGYGRLLAVRPGTARPGEQA